MKWLGLTVFCLAASAQTPNTPCPSPAPIHLTQGNLDGIWWQAASAQERRIYLEAYIDAQGYAKRRYSLTMTFLNDFYSDAAVRGIPVKNAIRAYFNNLKPTRRK